MESIGVVDIGSNTVRLSVVEVLPQGAYRVRHEEKAGLRLGARIGPDGELGPQAAHETARVILGFAWAAGQWGVREWVAVATAAVRQARDGLAFLAIVSERSGIPLRILGGDEEAALGMVGALNTLAERDGYLIDVGGASTEVTRFEGRRRIRSASLPLGAVNATAAFGLADRAPEGAIAALEAALDRAAGWAPEGGAASHWIRPQPDGTLIGLGGTVRALGKMDRRRRGYPLDATHNYVLNPEYCRTARDRLTALAARDRARLPGLGADRADLMAAGTAILAWAVARTAPRRLVVSGSGLREGLFYSRLLRDRPGHLYDDVLEASTRNLVRLYGLSEPRAERLAALADALWTALGPIAGAAPEVARLVRAAARLRGVGSGISYYDWQRHTGYVLREARLFGCDHRERMLLAAAAAFEGAARLREGLMPFSAVLQPGDDRLAVRMGLSLALAEQIDRQAQGAALPLQVTSLPSALRIATAATPEGGFDVPVPLAEDFRKWFGRALAVTSGSSPAAMPTSAAPEA